MRKPQRIGTGWISGFWVWATRDIVRRPSESALVAAALALLVAVTAIPLLLTLALSNTAARMFEEGPSLVVRRIDAGGWRPLPGEETARIAGSVQGVTAARPKVWGTANNGNRGGCKIGTIAYERGFFYLLLGWRDRAPGLYLDGSGAVVVLLEILSLVMLPFLLATLWPVLKGCAADPGDLFEREGL